MKVKDAVASPHFVVQINALYLQRSDNLRTKLWWLKFSKKATKLLEGFVASLVCQHCTATLGIPPQVPINTTDDNPMPILRKVKIGHLTRLCIILFLKLRILNYNRDDDDFLLDFV